MPRDLDPALVSYLQGRRLVTAFLVQAQFKPSTLYLTTHCRDIEFEGNTYIFAQSLFVGSQIQAQTLQNNEIELSLSGIPDSFEDIEGNTQYSANLLLTTQMVGKPIKITQVFFDKDTDEFIGMPFVVLNGPCINASFSDSMSEDGKANGTTAIKLSVGNIFSRFEERNNMLTNPSSHRRLWPGDAIFDQVPQLADKIIEFGKL